MRGERLKEGQGGCFGIVSTDETRAGREAGPPTLVLAPAARASSGLALHELQAAEERALLALLVAGASDRSLLCRRVLAAAGLLLGPEHRADGALPARPRERRHGRAAAAAAAVAGEAGQVRRRRRPVDRLVARRPAVGRLLRGCQDARAGVSAAALLELTRRRRIAGRTPKSAASQGAMPASSSLALGPPLGLDTLGRWWLAMATPPRMMSSESSSDPPPPTTTPGQSMPPNGEAVLPLVGSLRSPPNFLSRTRSRAAVSSGFSIGGELARGGLVDRVRGGEGCASAGSRRADEEDPEPAAEGAGG